MWKPQFVGGGYLEFFQYRRKKQRHHDLHVAGEIVAFAAMHSRSADDVGERPVVLEKIEIDRCQIANRVTEIARQADGL